MKKLSFFHTPFFYVKQVTSWNSVINPENWIFIKLESYVNIVVWNKYKRLPIDSRGETEIILSGYKKGWSLKMRGKVKQRVSLILVVTMVLGTALTGNTVFAVGGEAVPNPIR